MHQKLRLSQQYFGIIRNDEADRFAPNGPISLVVLILNLRGAMTKQWFTGPCATSR